jgi:MFS family permease
MSASPSETEKPPAPLSYVVGVLIFASLMTNAAQAVLPVVAPEAARDYGVKAALVGYQISLATVGALVALMFLGNLSARWGQCRVIQISVVLQGVFSLLLLVPNLWCLAIASLAMGVGYGSLTPAISGLLQRYTPPARRNLIFSLWQTGVPLGLVLTASVAPTVTLSYGWRVAIVGAAVLLLVAAALIEPLRRQADANRDPSARLARSPLPGIRLVLGNVRLRQMAIAAPCLSAAQFSVSTYTVVALVEGMGFGLVQAGMVLTVSQISAVLFRIACGWIADRLRDALVMLTGLAVLLLLSTLATLPMHAGWPVAAVFFVFAMIAGASNGHPGAYLAEVAHLAPRGEVASTTAGMLVFNNTGKMLGPVLFANVYLVTGSYMLTLGSTAILSVVCLWAFLSGRRAT